MTHTERTPYCHKIRYGITGAPILTEDEMDGGHAPGIGVSPELIELVYSAARDGKPASVSASVTGSWTRFGERADGQVAVHFKNGPDGWPAWLAEEARLHDPDAPAVPAGQAPATDQTALRDRIAEALLDHLSRTADIRHDTDGELAFMPVVTDEERMRIAAALAAVLPASVDRADDEAPLSPDYQHPECGFNWHGRDGMDIPMRDGQPVCPRCELASVEKRLRHSEKRSEELRVESKRRGKVKLEYAERIRQLENQLDEVRSQLGAEILRAGQAEAELRRLADESPSAVVVRRVTDETPGEAEVQLPFIHVDDDGDQLDIGAVMASTYDGEAPVVYVAAEQHQGDTVATVYVRPERVDEVIAALRSARLAAETLPAAEARQADETPAVGTCTNCRGSGLDPRYSAGEYACPDCPPAVGAQQPKEARPSPTEELLATRCDACRHTLNRHHQHGACTVVLCVCGTFQYPVEELPQ